MHERIQARRDVIMSGASNSERESRERLVSTLEELSASLERLATLPGRRFFSIYVAAVWELRSVAKSLSFTGFENAVEWEGVAATMVSLQLAIAVSAQAVGL